MYLDDDKFKTLFDFLSDQFGTASLPVQMIHVKQPEPPVVGSNYCYGKILIEIDLDSRSCLDE